MRMLITILLIPFVIVWHGYTLTILWDWFIVPVFELPVLTVIQAAGLMLVARFIQRWPKTNSRTAEEFVTDIALSFLGPLFVLGVGWILVQFL